MKDVTFKEKEDRAEKTFKEMSENIANQAKYNNPQKEESEQTLERINQITIQISLKI